MAAGGADEVVGEGGFAVAISRGGGDASVGSHQALAVKEE
jgi:hypothetical protein